MLLPVLLLAAHVGWSEPGQAQVAPDEAWTTRQTEHFRVIYPEELARLGERTAVRAEGA
ncbi:MAG: hypothetical protein GWM92_08290, partial [Gemmatimonadetes bacterium]|nr:hypothetical protein [Gemmatimonadota bacterium]NIT87260.1 hypothetical protein [Gemmatimonadota bacterium]NIU31104.1 hypothetical protein [Gemmatimonadota bacterium]NIU35838.1 hypothetical protein [Gemmatimonadota bacterium]NIV61466.1 hypothetical protein [Gemmatimonadota bacterium]